MAQFNLLKKEIFIHDYYPSISAYYFKTWVNFYMDFHRHDDLEIMYVLDGKCNVDIEHRSIEMRKGDFIFLDANIMHRLVLEKDKPCRMLNVEFSFVEKKRAFPSMRDLAKHQKVADLLSYKEGYVVLKDANEVFYTLKNLVFELDKKEDEKEMMVQLYFSQLIVQIARLLNEKREMNEQKQTNVYVKKTIEFLHHNYDCDLKMEDVGRVVNLHPGYLHRIFKKNTGCSVMEYLTTVRINKAKMLLAETDIPIIDISLYVGINSRQYFSILFKNIQINLLQHLGSPLNVFKSQEAL
ncbi:AraC family transcriptional regulator [Bacillus sp. JCM 19034]|uniref:AraC family transcriptional regulator n=1 Tax=Bacillus sp. JCM 19034 TaxID=1481928 RepID=UPI00078647CB|nr:AraC family transcriptional regulator [Bacillus sp. JCM 19034]